MDDDQLSTEELLRQMSQARAAVENARKQAQLHVSAALRGSEEWADSYQEQAEAALVASENRKLAAQHFERWGALRTRNARRRARTERGVAHWQRGALARTFAGWSRATYAALTAEGQELRARLDAAMARLEAVPDSAEHAPPPDGASDDDALVDRLTVQAQREMQETNDALEAKLAAHRARAQEAEAGRAEAARELEAVELEIREQEHARSTAESQLQRVRGDLEVDQAGKAIEERHRGRAAGKMQEMLQQVVAAKQAELSDVEQAIEQVKRAQQQQVASLSERIKEETELRREAESRHAELEQQLSSMEERVPAARSEYEQYQRSEKERRQRERDAMHARVQDEIHRRQTAEHRLDGIRSRLARVERDLAAARASAAAASGEMERSSGEIKSGLAEQLAEHTMSTTAAEIKHDTMQRTLDSKQQELLAATEAQQAREAELLEHRLRAEGEIAEADEAAQQMKLRCDKASSELGAVRAELQRVESEEHSVDSQRQAELKQLEDQLHDRSLARRAAEQQVEQRKRALHSVETNMDSARESLAAEKQSLFKLKEEVKEEMLAQVLQETLKAQEAFMNHEHVERALASMRAELEATQQTTESLRQEMLQHRHDMREQLRDATVATEAMQRLTQIAADSNSAAGAELERLASSRAALEEEEHAAERALAAASRDAEAQAQRDGSNEEQLRQRLSAADEELGLSKSKLSAARTERLRFEVEMDDALRSETLHERAAKQEADMLREHISEQDTTNASLRERNATINAQLRALAIEGASVQ